MPFPLPDCTHNRRHARGAKTRFDAPPTTDAPYYSVTLVVLRAHFMEKTALHPLFSLWARVMSRGFQRESSILAGIPHAAANPGSVPAEILNAETVTGGAN
jgi:hypothetical protein